MKRIGEFGEDISIDTTHPSPVGELPKIGEGTHKVAPLAGRPTIYPADPIGTDRTAIGESLHSNRMGSLITPPPGIDKPGNNL